MSILNEDARIKMDYEFLADGNIQVKEISNETSYSCRLHSEKTTYTLPGTSQTVDSMSHRLKNIG